MTNVDSQAAQAQQPQPQVQTLATDGGKQMALIVYILYFAGFLFGLPALAGVIIAHIKVSEASPVFRTHFQYQMRTFWFGLLMLFIGGLTSLILIGYLVFLLWLVWTLVRCIKGLIRVSEGRAIEQPTTLLW